jgi:hypothetical protein
MNCSRPQPVSGLHHLAVTPFVPFRLFLHGATKRDERCQKVPAHDLPLFLPRSADLLVCGFPKHSCPVFPRSGTGDWQVARPRRSASLRHLMSATVNALERIKKCCRRQAVWPSSPSSDLRTPSPPLGEKAGMRGYRPTLHGHMLIETATVLLNPV